MREMPVCAIKMIRQIRATLTALLPIGAKHKVINNQLAAVVEKVGERFLAVRSVEDVLLFHFNPWQLSSMATHFVTQPRQLFFPGQQVLACDEPLSF
jgi:hypothetical protein